MYKRHKLLLFAVFVGSFFITFLLGLDFSPMAEAAITVASIAMGVYIAAVSALLGSDYAKNNDRRGISHKNPFRSSG